MIRHACTECDGAGSTLSEDYDEHGRHAIRESCEACDGCGQTTTCAQCSEPVPATEADRYGGMCWACAEGWTQRDESDERATWRRTG